MDAQPGTCPQIDPNSEIRLDKFNYHVVHTDQGEASMRRPMVNGPTRPRFGSAIATVSELTAGHSIW